MKVVPNPMNLSSKKNATVTIDGLNSTGSCCGDLQNKSLVDLLIDAPVSCNASSALNNSLELAVNGGSCSGADNCTALLDFGINVTVFGYGSECCAAMQAGNASAAPKSCMDVKKFCVEIPPLMPSKAVTYEQVAEKVLASLVI